MCLCTPWRFVQTRSLGHYFPYNTAVHHQEELNQEVTCCKPDVFAFLYLLLFRIIKKKATYKIPDSNQGGTLKTKNTFRISVGLSIGEPYLPCIFGTSKFI